MCQGAEAFDFSRILPDASLRCVNWINQVGALFRAKRPRERLRSFRAFPRCHANASLILHCPFSARAYAYFRREGTRQVRSDTYLQGLTLARPPEQVERRGIGST